MSWVEEGGFVYTYAIAWLDFTVPDRFHHTPLLITHIPDPIRLAGRYEHVRSESIDASVQLLVFVNLEPFRVLDLARLAVVVAVFAIDRRVHFGEDEGGYSGNGVRGCARGEEGFALLKDRGKRHLRGGGGGGVGHGRLGTEKSRHIGEGSRSTGYCTLPLGGIRKHKEEAIFFI